MAVIAKPATVSPSTNQTRAASTPAPSGPVTVPETDASGSPWCLRRSASAVSTSGATLRFRTKVTDASSSRSVQPRLVAEIPADETSAAMPSDRSWPSSGQKLKVASPYLPTPPIASRSSNWSGSNPWCAAQLHRSSSDASQPREGLMRATPLPRLV